jgi:opacity protein-like surface antigen
LQVKLDDTLKILKEMQDKRARQEKRFVRIEVTGNYFQPAEGEFKDTFGNGLMEGAELNIGVTNSLEFWLAMKNFSKSSLEGDTAQDHKIRLIPLEAGFKLRFNKGTVNPYIGGGIAYHQYKELYDSEEIKEKKIGFIGQAGCFLKIAENLVLDVYAHYRYCLINVGETELDISGFHIGAGLGFEF